MPYTDSGHCDRRGGSGWPLAVTRERDTRLTRTRKAASLNIHAFRQTHFSSRTRPRTHGLCLRLRHNSAGRRNAVLQLDALLIARSSWAGVLQDHAGHARSLCAALSCARRFLLVRSFGSAARLPRFDGLGFFCPRGRGTFSRSSDSSRSRPRASSRLVCPPAGSRLTAFVCFVIAISS